MSQVALSTIGFDDAVQGDEPIEVSNPWPRPLEDYAFQGPLGMAVKRIAPYTESDEAALMFQMMAVFGNIIGRTTHYSVEADEHYGNLFICLVGDTSKARKGTSWSHVRRFFSAVDMEWHDHCQKKGLVSGEGLIHNVRDPVMKWDPKKSEMVEVDGGIDDKRLFVQESEFASVLKIFHRRENTLSPVLREAWDCAHHLRTMAKNSPEQATHPHISVCGHITSEELVRMLTATEMANGLGNRFLWVCVKRSKMLPFGGTLEAMDYGDLQLCIRDAAVSAGTRQEIRMSREARSIWEDNYPELSAGGTGLLGSVTSRAEAQVIRMALILSLADRLNYICPEHLHAALELWRYCADSAKHIFGDSLGNPDADMLFAAITRNRGMSRTEINHLFGRNKPAEQIASILAALIKSGKVAQVEDETARGPGRKPMIYCPANSRT